MKLQSRKSWSNVNWNRHSKFEQLKNNLDQENEAMHKHETQIQIHLQRKYKKPQRNQTQQNNQRLISLSLANQKPRQEIIWLRNISKFDIKSNYKYQQEISQLKKLNRWNKQGTINNKKKNNKRSKNIKLTREFKEQVSNLCPLQGPRIKVQTDLSSLKKPCQPCQFMAFFIS